MGFKSPKETTCSVDNIGCNKIGMAMGPLLALGFLAGAFIAFGGLLAVIVGGGVPDIKLANPGLQKFIFGAVFPVGLILVVVAGAELFTGNTACCIPAVLSGKASWSGLARNWTFSYVGNLIGSLFVVLFLTYMTGLFASDPWLSSITGIAEAKVSQGFWPLFFKGVGCNWLVCLAVWLAIASDDVASKIFGVWFPIMAFVAMGLSTASPTCSSSPRGSCTGPPSPGPTSSSST